MDVILLESMGKLGRAGDKVSVKSGFGRNYLIPQGKALPATAANLEEFNSRRAELEVLANERKLLAEKKALELSEMTVIISANAGEEGKLFGSIGTRDIAEALVKRGVEVAKADVCLPEGAIRDLGEYNVIIKLHSEITQSVKVIIEKE